MKSADSWSTCSPTLSLNHALYPVWISGPPYPNDPLESCTLPNPHPAGSINTESVLSSFLRIHTHYFVLWALRSPVPCYNTSITLTSRVEVWFPWFATEFSGQVWRHIIEHSLAYIVKALIKEPPKVFHCATGNISKSSYPQHNKSHCLWNLMFGKFDTAWLIGKEYLPKQPKRVL